jgi:hypothetical protein
VIVALVFFALGISGFVLDDAWNGQDTPLHRRTS